MSLQLGKCIATARKNVIRLLVPQLKFDSFLNKHFRENDSLLAHDEENVCREGDWVLIRQLDQRFSLDINHRVEKVVYQAGNIIDPISKQKSVGYQTVEDIHHLSDLFKKNDPPR